MDADRPAWLFDPSATRTLVLTRRPPGGRAVDDVVSDLVWTEVVRLLRWATAGSTGPAHLRTGALWRLAAEGAALLRRMPVLCAETGQPWSVLPPAPPAPGTPPARQVEVVAGRLARLLAASGPTLVTLPALAAEVDALGEAAVQAIAASSFTTGRAGM
ncbi:hypothetical protein ACI78R_11395 [Geodermatophilus sp. SYSU D01106]